MERAHHRRAPGRARGRRATIFAALVAITLLVASCSTDDPSAEPSVRDTVAGGTGSNGSILQATTADGGTDDDRAQGTTSDGTGDTSDGAGDTSGSTTGGPASSATGDGGFCGSSQPTAIQFDRGTTSATIDLSPSDAQRDLFTLEVGAGQILTVQVESADSSATASLRAPTTDLPSTDFTERTIVPTRQGSYEICVSAGASGTDAQLLVSVIDDNTPDQLDAAWCGSTVNDRGEIRFDPGAFGTTIEGGVLRDERDVHVMEAGAGQFLELFLTSLEDNAVFDLRSPSGETLIDGVSDFRIPLPEDGDYQICIGSIRGNASYTLDVSIT